MLNLESPLLMMQGFFKQRELLSQTRLHLSALLQLPMNQFKLVYDRCWGIQCCYALPAASLERLKQAGIAFIEIPEETVIKALAKFLPYQLDFADRLEDLLDKLKKAEQLSPKESIRAKL